MPRHYDAVIIGGSLAGSSTAITLAKAGLRVAVLDRAEFPRNKPCGEGLSTLGVAALCQLGIHQQVLQLPHVALRGFHIHRLHGLRDQQLAREERSFPLRVPEGKIVGIGIERYHLDDLLLRTAQNSKVLVQSSHNVSVFERMPVREIVQGKSCMLVRAGNSASELFSSPFIVAADGGRSFAARQLEVPVRPFKKNRFGFRFLLEGRNPHDLDSVHIFVRSDHEIYCTPVSPNRLNVAVLGTKRAIGEMITSDLRGEVIKMLATELDFEAVEIGEAMAVGPLCRVSGKSYWKRCFFVGDAVEGFDPLGGMGMTHALYSGIAAAESSLKIINEEWEVDDAGREYQLHREQIARKLRGFTRLTYRALARRDGALLLPLISRGERFSIVESALNAARFAKPSEAVAPLLGAHQEGALNSLAVSTIQFCIALAGIL